MEYTSSQKCLTAMETHMPCGITECYMPPARGNSPAFSPAN